ncbi:MAG TPA: hypothetical protein VFB58_12155 [Chloroflexota bacterium]|nr:hypothetical protein [Chloroflexota bacterium]
MSKTVVSAIAVLALAASAALPAYARSSHHMSHSGSSHIVFRQVSKSGRTIDLRTRVLSGHVYRIEVSSKGHRTVTLTGFQQYSYVSHRQLYSSFKNVRLHGKTPYSYVLHQPTSQRLGEWDLMIEVQVMPWHSFTVQVRDITKH